MRRGTFSRQPLKKKTPGLSTRGSRIITVALSPAKLGAASPHEEAFYMHPEDKKSAVPCQARIGRVTLKAGPRGTGAALVPVLRPFEGRWAVAGLVRVDLRRAPTSRGQRQKAIHRAIRTVLAALAGGPQS